MVVEKIASSYHLAMTLVFLQGNLFNLKIKPVLPV